MMVDMKAMQSIHHHLEKVLEDVCHTAKVLGEAMCSQKSMDPGIRESADSKEQSAAHSTASLGPTDNPQYLQNCSLTTKANKSFKLMVCQC